MEKPKKNTQNRTANGSGTAARSDRAASTRTAASTAARKTTAAAPGRTPPSRRPAPARSRSKGFAFPVKPVVATVACAIAIFIGFKVIQSIGDGDIDTSRASAGQDVNYTVVLPTSLVQLTPAPTEAPAVFVQSSDWNLLLVNRWHAIPDSFTAPELTTLSNGNSLDKRAYPSLQNMFDDARSAGVYPTVVSGFRTYEDQQAIYNDKVKYYTDSGYSEADAKTMAAQDVEMPGTSEHETGLAIDINADTSKGASEDVYTWLAENSYKYGFILRYPADKTGITGMNYEQSHFRYVGAEAAAAMHNANQCLEEYLGVVDAGT